MEANGVNLTTVLEDMGQPLAVTNDTSSYSGYG